MKKTDVFCDGCGNVITHVIDNMAKVTLSYTTQVGETKYEDTHIELDLCCLCKIPMIKYIKGHHKRMIKKDPWKEYRKANPELWKSRRTLTEEDYE